MKHILASIKKYFDGDLMGLSLDDEVTGYEFHKWAIKRKYAYLAVLIFALILALSNHIK